MTHWRDKGVIVHLTEAETTYAAEEGMRRRIVNAFHGNAHNHGAKDDGQTWDTNVEGAIAELSAAKHFGVPWTGYGEGSRGREDIEGFEVRSSTKLGSGMPIHRSDPPDAIFLWVVGSCGNPYRIVGWMKASEAQDPKNAYWTNLIPRAAFLIRQPVLHDLSELEPVRPAQLSLG